MAGSAGSRWSAVSDLVEAWGFQGDVPYEHARKVALLEVVPPDLRVLMVAAKNLHARNARIAVAALQPVVVEIFDIARFAHVLEVFPTVRDAVAALSPSALAAWDATR